MVDLLSALLGVAGTAVTAGGGVVAKKVTSRTEREKTATDGWETLTNQLQEENARLSARLEAETAARAADVDRLEKKLDELMRRIDRDEKTARAWRRRERAWRAAHPDPDTWPTADARLAGELDDL